MLSPVLEVAPGQPKFISRTSPAHVSYQASDAVICVRVTSQDEHDAVIRFAKDNGFCTPASPAARPVYHCTCRTYPNGDVLWA